MASTSPDDQYKPSYQGAYKSIPLEEDDLLYSALHYVKRNQVRFRLVELGEDWRWNSL